jgi:hypothetical protein
MKILIETNAYSVCQRCERGATHDDPLLKMGHFVEWVILHKSCFDILVREAGLLHSDWIQKQIDLGKLPPKEVA